MKLSNMIMILIIIQAVIIMYDSVYDSNTYELTSYSDNETILWNFVANPTDWTGTDLIKLFASLTAVAGAIGIGVYLVTKSDTSLFFGVFTFFLGLGAIPIISLYEVFMRNVSMFGCTSIPCLPAILVWVLTGGILAVFYVLSVLEWWSSRSMG